MAPRFEHLNFEVTSPFRSISPTQEQRIQQSGSDWVVYRMRFEGLNPTETYLLNIREDRSHDIQDQRQFTTISTKSSGRVALLSCMLRQFHNPFMWNSLSKPENRPDLMLFIGDSVYLDRSRLLFKKNPTSALQVWEDFVRARNKLNVYFWSRLVPIVSVWDDHDAGGDNVDAWSFPFMDQIRGIYETFFANEEIEGLLSKGPALSKRLQIFGQNLIILDGRSFRNMEDAYPLFGKNQERWLFKNIRPGGNLLISGSQFYGGYLKKDSMEFNWPDYAKDFTNRLKEFGALHGSSFAFASGDIHFSQIQHLEADILGYPSVEITSSSVHSMTLPGWHYLYPFNPRESAATSTHNVILLDFNSQDLKFHVRSVSWRNGTPFEEDIEVKAPCERLLLQKAS